jgi:hypothetical protein
MWEVGVTNNTAKVSGLGMAHAAFQNVQAFSPYSSRMKVYIHVYS